MLVLYGLLLLPLVLSAVGATGLNFSECRDRSHSHTEAPSCSLPIQDVVAVAPGSLYTAKIRCYDCPRTNKAMHSEPEIVFEDNDLVCS